MEFLSSYKDGFNFVSKLTPSKIINGLKVMGSYYRSRWTGKVNHKGLPVSMSVEPTTACNLRCPECPSGLRSFTRDTGALTLDTFKSLIEELKDQLTYLLLYFQGEPYLNKNFFDMVKIASKNKIYTATSTNAHYLTPENAEKTVRSGIDRVIISIDGTTQEVYQQYRVGGKLEKVIEGTKNLVNARKKLQSKTPFIIFQFLVVRPNEHQIDDIKKLAKKLKVDKVAFKSAQIYNYKNGSPLIPENEKYSRYKKQNDNTYRLKSEPDDSCWKMWHSCVMTWDGKIVPCCFDKDAHHNMGSISDQPFKKIWHSKPYNAFRTQLFESRDQIEICKNCSEGSKVWV
ncbi:radical SAM/SPASM domain-containing protein [Mangrovivirga sp. M17]|uniref:Radical SAM/SPASM domain-containing protein n=1 Tax=Mangrovivirga halotolerans TaxID=2993936 RepID=A0ABT3RTB6_9BACT|nr:radical SAM/SPASM domain-containing protein [Mangrovivirga halotolerans]MCX2744594.1 radical SAM/SPASM domain-containing protein [Mangrovivirga halotolerans]